MSVEHYYYFAAITGVPWLKSAHQRARR
jgi:hypothetical protein